MEFKVFSLRVLLETLGLEEVRNILATFKGITTKTSAPHDVEVFLRIRAIDFEKSGISSTYLLLDEDTKELVGFFSLANKPLIFSKKDFQALSKNKQKAFNRYGRRLESGGHQVNSYLIGQLGKNYASSTTITGKELLTYACEKIGEAAQIINTRYIWLECEDIPKLIEFYTNFGFSVVNNFTSQDNLKVLIMKIEK
ncbi:GNAT family N-acetyltransferase [Streptococcus suis]|uniref:GNAT family N-acetyltransferase n=1 Tax=Streptococcus suis TaxID=1307 RepID=UPI001479428D|nr:GNAT family N-acetyltransferase [Streptococcus suis]MBY5006060.1 GNAT family N-acetyltransferase [Streptococcus suis]MBY5022150.1 GNAT family N-acetyltransferase [Streptococcus suis]MCB2890388.1 GNAT family N-acetyltransferase [Streptococcus suis]NQR20597.1 GNAT family N-acetyltransferase [Streptococcus suis]HEL2402994.1 GNAT family N-acetyltransferase [Streptococcus suis]